jgi:hypothetical protein
LDNPLTYRACGLFKNCGVSAKGKRYNMIIGQLALIVASKDAMTNRWDAFAFSILQI